MPAVFTFVPSLNFRKTNKSRVIECRFGEGYSQRMGDGLNTINMEWQVTFENKPIAEAQAIVAFFETAGTGQPGSSGVDYFLWTPPNDTIQYKVICADYEETYTSHISRTVTATFRRVYDL